MKVVNVGVVGSRKRNTPEDKQLIRQALIHLIGKDEDVKIHIISGGCRQGADRFAEELAKELNLGMSTHYPDLASMKEDSRYEYARVCYERNFLIARDSDILIALPSRDENGMLVGGTADTVRKAEKLKKSVVLL